MTGRCVLSLYEWIYVSMYVRIICTCMPSLTHSVHTNAETPPQDRRRVHPAVQAGADAAGDGGAGHQAGTFFVSLLAYAYIYVAWGCVMSIV